MWLYKSPDKDYPIIIYDYQKQDQVHALKIFEWVFRIPADRWVCGLQ